MIGQRYSAGVVNPSPTPSLEGRDFGFARAKCLVGVSGDFEFFQDCNQDAVGVLQDVVVPETDYAVTVGFDDLRSGVIGGAVAVLPAIKFDRKPGGAARKIDHVIPDRILPREFETANLAGAQVRPQPPFRVGHVIAQLARYVSQSFLSQCRTPIPNPFPQGKGLSVAKPG